jgi:SAM-dependent methyltransferase
MHALEAGRGEEALFMLLGLSGARAAAFRALLARPEPATYREALAILCQDAEGACFEYRLSDPTYVMIEGLLHAIGQQATAVAGRILDVGGGSGHLTRVLLDLQTGTGAPPSGTVLADLFFWKLWLATRFNAPAAVPVCCDASAPLPFVSGAFSLVLLADAFPYIWHKRLAADELVRLAGPGGIVVLPHLHSALGENFSAGNTLTPAAYRDLFAAQQPRLFSDVRLFTDLLDERAVDLSNDVTPEGLGAEPSCTLIASRKAEVFRRYRVPASQEVTGALLVNPLYRVEHRDGSSLLTLTFPTPEYEEEFGECRRYLPETVTIDADLSGALVPATFGAAYEELRRRRIVIDAPPRY